MSENVASLPKGVIGTSLRMGPFEIQGPPREDFLKFIRPYMSKCHGEDAFEINLLSDEKAPLGTHYSFHGHPKPSVITEFAIRIQRKPDAKPPASIEAQNNEIGGFAIGFDGLISSLGAPKVTCSAKLQGHILDTKTLIPQLKAVRQKRDFEPLSLVGETLIFSHKKGQIEISFSEGGEPLFFEVSAKISIDLNSSFVEQTCDHFWNGFLKEIFDHASTLKTTKRKTGK